MMMISKMTRNFLLEAENRKVQSDIDSDGTEDLSGEALSLDGYDIIEPVERVK